MTTRILALTDAPGNLARFRPMPGNRDDGIGVSPVIEGVAFDGLITDKTLDNTALVADFSERGTKIGLSRHPARALKIVCVPCRL
jgi:hypothetical protein